MDELIDSDYRQLWITLKNLFTMIALMDEINPQNNKKPDRTLMTIMTNLENKLIKEKKERK
jgi:hypothetical protein